MSITSLILMVIFIIIPIVISKSLKLGLEKRHSYRWYKVFYSIINCRIYITIYF